MKGLNSDQVDSVGNCFEIPGQNLSELYDCGSQIIEFLILIDQIILDPGQVKTETCFSDSS